MGAIFITVRLSTQDYVLQHIAFFSGVASACFTKLLNKLQQACEYFTEHNVYSSCGVEIHEQAADIYYISCPTLFSVCGIPLNSVIVNSMGCNKPHDW